MSAADVPWSSLLIVIPLAGGMVCFLAPRIAKLLGVTTALLVGASVVGLGRQILMNGPERHLVGGWGAPLGIELYADGLTLLMLAAAALVAVGVSIYGASYFKEEQAKLFWPIWLFLLGALNALFLAADVFNLYVTLELMGLAAVALTALEGGRDAISGAMRYMLATLLGSLLYLLGIGLLYHGFGSVDIATLAERVEASPSTWAAIGLISAGLMIKAALFPLHFWLPPAHASASAPVSALLSALVVKAPFYILLRLWLEVFSPLDPGIDELLGLLGAAAVVWGGLQALRQTKLKLLIAYSTVAQIGYLFMAFPIAAAAGVNAWFGAVYLVLSHALAKSAMFLAAGNLIHFGKHDRIAYLDRVVQRLPVSAGAFALAAVSIMGLPPTGGFVGKWLMLESAFDQEQWHYIVVIILGTLLAAGYVFKVLGHAFTPARTPHKPRDVPAALEWTALTLAVLTFVLGFLAPSVDTLVGVGNLFGLGLRAP